MIGGMFVIFLIMVYIIVVAPILKYYREHQATPQQGQYMQNGEKVISGYLPIRLELMLMENRKHFRDPENIPSIYPLDKIDFLNYNEMAKREYTDCLVRAIAWDHGYIPMSMCLKRHLDPFKSYNNLYRGEEENYYSNNDCVYRKNQNQRMKRESEYAQYGFYGKTLSFKFDVRNYWSMDPYRNSF